MKKVYYLIPFIFSLIVGCAAQKAVVDQSRKIKIPAGVDSLTVLAADSIFTKVAVTEDIQKEAADEHETAQLIWALGDTLWNMSVQDTLSHSDSTRIPGLIDRAKQYFQGDKERSKLFKKSKRKLGLFNKEFVAIVSKELMPLAIRYNEKAIAMNKFEINYRLRLIQNLQTYAERLKDRNALRRAAAEMEGVVGEIKDNHRFYYQVGKIYYDLLNWKSAFIYSELATKTIRSTAIFNTPNPELYFTKPDAVPLDTTVLVNYLYQQALCKTKVYEDIPALALFKEAQSVTPLETYKQTFQQWIDWINWDDGNIRASELRDIADSLRRDKKYQDAKIAYLNLLPVLRAPRTFDQISWRIAVIDYSNLELKTDGLYRMHQIIQRSVTDSLTGAPADTAYQVYFDSYGTMCYNSGVENLNSDLTKAYIYFNQAADNFYKERGKAFLQLAMLSEYDPRETIQLCEKANKYFDLFDQNEKQHLYRLYYSSYRKLGDFITSKQWFDRWKNL